MVYWENGENLLRCRSERFDFCLDAGLKYPENEQLGVGCRYPQHGLSIWKQGPLRVFSSWPMVTQMPLALPYLLAEAKVPVGTEPILFTSYNFCQKAMTVWRNSTTSMSRSEFWDWFWWCRRIFLSNNPPIPGKYRDRDWHPEATRLATETLKILTKLPASRTRQTPLLSWDWREGVLAPWVIRLMRIVIFKLPEQEVGDAI